MKDETILLLVTRIEEKLKLDDQREWDNNKRLTASDVEIARISEKARTNRWLITILGCALFYMFKTM